MIDEILALLRAIDGDIDRIDEAAAHKLGISRTDFRCLDLLSRGSAMTPGQIAAELGLSTGATTALLDRLEKGGFVYRERDTKDRRRIFVKTSPKSAQLVWPMFKGTVTGATRLLNRFHADEIETILRFLKMNRAMIREHLPPRRG